MDINDELLKFDKKIYNSTSRDSYTGLCKSLVIENTSHTDKYHAVSINSPPDSSIYSVSFDIIPKNITDRTNIRNKVMIKYLNLFEKQYQQMLKITNIQQSTFSIFKSNTLKFENSPTSALKLFGTICIELMATLAEFIIPNIEWVELVSQVVQNNTNSRIINHHLLLDAINSRLEKCSIDPHNIANIILSGTHFLDTLRYIWNEKFTNSFAHICGCSISNFNEETLEFTEFYMMDNILYVKYINWVRYIIKYNNTEKIIYEQKINQSIVDQELELNIIYYSFLDEIWLPPNKVIFDTEILRYRSSDLNVLPFKINNILQGAPVVSMQIFYDKSGGIKINRPNNFIIDQSTNELIIYDFYYNEHYNRTKPILRKIRKNTDGTSPGSEWAIDDPKLLLLPIMNTDPVTIFRRKLSKITNSKSIEIQWKMLVKLAKSDDIETFITDDNEISITDDNKTPITDDIETPITDDNEMTNNIELTKIDFLNCLQKMKLDLPNLWLIFTGPNGTSLNINDIIGRWIPICYSENLKSLISGRFILGREIISHPIIIKFLKYDNTIMQDMGSKKCSIIYFDNIIMKNIDYYDSTKEIIYTSTSYKSTFSISDNKKHIKLYDGGDQKILTEKQVIILPEISEILSLQDVILLNNESDQIILNNFIIKIIQTDFIVCLKNLYNIISINMNRIIIDNGRSILIAQPWLHITPMMRCLLPRNFDMLFFEINIFNCKINNPLLVIEACTHSSHTNNITPSYKCLSILGYTIIKYFVVEFLLAKNNIKTPEWIKNNNDDFKIDDCEWFLLANIKNTLDIATCAASLSHACIALEIHDHILCNDTLTEVINMYKKNNESLIDFMISDTTKIFADTFCALIGAIVLSNTLTLSHKTISKIIINELLKPLFMLKYFKIDSESDQILAKDILDNDLLTLLNNASERHIISKQFIDNESTFIQDYKQGLINDLKFYKSPSSSNLYSGSCIITAKIRGYLLEKKNSI